MQTTLYLIRHCEAAGNLHRTFQGRIDSEISERGALQLECLSRRFAGIHLDAVYSSPLRRAWRTAEAVSRASGLSILPEEGLIEIDGGAFEGLPFDEIPARFPEAYHDWTQRPGYFAAPGGETMQQVFLRVCDAIERMVRAHPGQTIAAASHGCAIRNYQCRLLGLPVTELGQVGWCDNTGVSCLVFDTPSSPRAVYLNDISHLTQELSTFAAQGRTPFASAAAPTR